MGRAFDASLITSRTPLRLSRAVDIVWPDGGMTVAGLYLEYQKGNLPLTKIANKLFVTLDDIERMRGLSLSLDEVAKLPRSTPEDVATGIYFLWHEGKCVYVGQGRNVHKRVVDHRCSPKSPKIFDSYSWFPCPADRLLDTEAKYIRALQPRYNVARVPGRLKARGEAIRTERGALAGADNE